MDSSQLQKQQQQRQRQSHSSSLPPLAQQQQQHNNIQTHNNPTYNNDQTSPHRLSQNHQQQQHQEQQQQQQQQETQNNVHQDSTFEHVVFQDSQGGYFIVSGHPLKASVYFVVAIDMLSGSIVSHGALGYDLFTTQQDAFDSLEQRGLKVSKKVCAKAILGLVSFQGGVSYLLIATKTKSDTILPGNHVVHTVMEHEWICTSRGWINGVLDLGTQQKLHTLQSYPLSGTHYYCSSFDITRPYPSSHSVDDPDTLFCWNGWMRQSFEKIGLGALCVPLLQGMAFSAPLPLPPQANNESDSGQACFILRRNQMNPGTKHNAGGMNERGVPGNESELEILLWTFMHAQPHVQQPTNKRHTDHKPAESKLKATEKMLDDDIDPELAQINKSTDRSGDDDENEVPNIRINTDMNGKGFINHTENGNRSKKYVRWAGYVWRRGMVPLWWQILPNRGTSANTNVADMDTTTSSNANSGGVASFGGNDGGDGGSGGNFFSANSGTVAPLTGVVHHNPFQQCAAYYQRVLNNYDSLLHLLLLRPESLDYQEAALSDFLAKSLKHVLKTFGKPIEIVDFDWITSLRAPGGLNNSVENLWNKVKTHVKESNYSAGSDGRGKVATRRQTRIMRIACSDSLERTHMVNFFLALPIVVELAKSVGLLPTSQAFASFEQPLEYVTRTLKNIGLLDIVTTVFVHLGEVSSLLFANQLAGAPTVLASMLRGHASLSRPLLLDLDQRLHDQRSYIQSNSENTRNSHYQLFLGSEAPPSPLVLVSHKSLILTSTSVPPNNPRQPNPPSARDFTMVIILPKPAYVHELIISGAGGCKMSASLGSYADANTHQFALHGVLIPHSNSSVVFTLPQSPFKTHSPDYLAPFTHRPTRVVKLTFTYNWQPIPEPDKTNSNTKITINFPDTKTNFTQPYVGVLGHWIGVSDVLSTPDAAVEFPTDFSEESTNLFGSSIPQRSENSMNQLCVSRTVDDIISLLEQPTYTESTPNQSPILHRNTSPNLPRSHSPTQLKKTLSQVALQLRPSLGASDGSLPDSSKGQGDSHRNTGATSNSIKTSNTNSINNTNNNNTNAYQSSTASTSVAAAAAAAANAVTSAVTTISTTIGGTHKNEFRNSQTRPHSNTFIDETSTVSKHGKEATNLEKYRTMAENTRFVGFTQALELECYRIQLGLDEHARDSILAELGCTLEYYNPSHYQFYRDEKTEGAIRKARTKTGHCQVGSQNCTGSLAIFGRKQCACCGKRSCTNCIAGTSERVVEFKWEKPVQVCVFCANEISRQTHCLALLKAHSDIKTPPSSSIPNKAWFQLIAAACAKSPQIARSLNTHYKQETINCAEFPQACIVKNVSTDIHSPPIESVLFSHSNSPLTMFWQSSPSIPSVDIIIALPFIALVRELVLLVDAKGYTPLDAPVLKVCVGNSVQSVEQFLATSPNGKNKSTNETNPQQPSKNIDTAYGVGEWAVDMEGYSPCSTLIFPFPEPLECQIVGIKFSLPKDTQPNDTPSTDLTRPPFQPAPSPTVDSMSILDNVRQSHLEGNWNQFSDSFQPTHTPIGPTMEGQQAPYLHIGRIRIHGSSPISHTSTPFPLSLYRPLPLSPPHPQPPSPPTLSRSNSFRTSPIPLNAYQPPEGWKAVIPTGDSAKGRSLEITLSGTGTRLVGFGLTVQHSPSGFPSQVCAIRLSALQTNLKAEIASFHNFGRILVPKTSPNTTLYFHMPSTATHTHMQLNVVLFEFLSSYGSYDAAPCTINLFS